ncbi:MAG: hypothetical protein QM768_00390 [Agriterribacter sp.]
MLLKNSPIRYIIFIIVYSIICVQVYSQDCEKLERASFFKNIKYGNPVPEALIQCAGINDFTPGQPGQYLIEYDKLERNCKKKNAGLFDFMNTHFSFANIYTDDKGNVNIISLYTFFNDNRNDAVILDLPDNFTHIYNKLTALYGNSILMSYPAQSDTLFIRDLGLPYSREWECNNMIIRLNVRYGSRVKNLNVLEVQIINGIYLPPEVETLEQ